jgi:hypothetical protein
VNLLEYIPAEGQPRWTINESFMKNFVKMGKVGNISAEIKNEAAGIGRASFVPATPVVDFCDRFLNPVYTINRTVKLNIDNNPDSFGKYYAKAMETDGLSVDEFVEKARSYASDDMELNALGEDQRFVAFEYPTAIIGHLNYMQRFVPGSIGDITGKFITDYRNFSVDFCRRLAIMRTRLERYFRTGDYSSRGYESNYMNMIDRLEKLCCGNEKLEVVMREIERRKAEILKNLSFAMYADQHPGLEHKAGSHRGGTFVIVYTSSSKQVQDQPAFRNPATGKFVAAGIAGAAREVVATHYNDIDSFALYVVSNDEKINREEELASFFVNNNISQGSAYSEYVIKELNTKIAAISKIICRDMSQPAADIVIADFCLPYLCCTECPPVAFIMPKESPPPEVTVSLSLDKNPVCSNSDPLKFTVTPADGLIAAADPAFSASVEQNADGNTYFNPQKVNNGQFGTAITFTVNGKPADCSIVVQSPVSLVLDCQVNDTETDNFDVVFFNNTDESKSGKLSYLWKFSDGSPDATQDGAGQFTVTFSKKKLQESGITLINVTVNVLNDPCNSTGTLSFDVPKVQVKDPCISFVTDFIDFRLNLLNSPDFAKRVEKLGSPDVQSFYQTTVELFDASIKIIETNDQARKLKIIIKTDDILQAIYKFKIDSTNPEMPRLLEELLRDLLMLMLNLVRCDDKISDQARQVIISNIRMFHEMRGQLQEKYPQLDLANVLEDDVTDFVKNFVSQDGIILETLKMLIGDLANFPQ